MKLLPYGHERTALLQEWNRIQEATAPIFRVLGYREPRDSSKPNREYQWLSEAAKRLKWRHGIDGMLEALAQRKETRP